MAFTRKNIDWFYGSVGQMFPEVSGGTPRIFMAAAPVAPEFTDEDELDTDLTSSGTTVAVLVGATFAAGDIIQIGYEKMLVEAVVTNDLTVIRAIDGTIAVAHGEGAIVKKVGYGFSTDDDLSSSGTTVALEAGYTGIISAYTLLRPQVTANSRERLYVSNAVGTSLTVERNFSLEESQDADRVWGSGTIFIVCAEDFYTPDSDSNLSANWLELESLEGVETEPTRDTTVLETDQRGEVDNLITKESFKITYNSPNINPIIMGLMDQINPSVDNNVKTGIRMKSNKGCKPIHIMLFIKSTCETGSYSLLLPACSLMNSVSPNYTNDQSVLPYEYMAVYSNALDCIDLGYTVD